MAAGGAGSIFQEAQQDAGENSGVGPLPADINMVAPPHLMQHPPTSQAVTHSSQSRVAAHHGKHALRRSSPKTLKSALGRPARPLLAPTPICTPRGNQRAEQ